jgi:hypothetical protein
LFGRREAQMNRSAPGYKEKIRTLSQETGPSERNCVVASRDRTADRPIQPLRLKEQHWIRISNGREKKAFGVIRECRANYLDPRSLAEL